MEDGYFLGMVFGVLFCCVIVVIANKKTIKEILNA